jgi:hypothetical protein
VTIGEGDMMRDDKFSGQQELFAVIIAVVVFSAVGGAAYIIADFLATYFLLTGN